MSSVSAQNPVVQVGSITTCASGTVVTVPITVQNFTNIGAVSLDLIYDSTKLTYTGFNSSALTGSLIVNNPTAGGIPLGRVLVSWFSLTASNLGNGLLMNFTFTANASATLTWNTAVAGQCELADGNGDPLNTTYNNGSVTISPISITTQPVANLSLNAGTSGSLSVFSSGGSAFQWQVSASGVAWTNLTDGGGYSGTSTSTLGIVASSTMNGNQYRVEISSPGCSSVFSSLSTLSVSSNTSVPVLTTTVVTGITPTVAITGGDITSDGGSAVTARGVAFGTGSNPTTAGGITIDGSGTGSYTSTLSGL
ncbi:MAG: cohesin domain-containing protein, partial [Bacteroidota bacterium]